MKCPYCNKYVLKNEIECPNCHNNLILGDNKYGGEGQYRSRFKLLIKFMVGGGAYLRWLGYNEEANEYAKNEIDRSFSLIGNVFASIANPYNLIKTFIDFFTNLIKNTINFFLIILGVKYKYDAYGHPVCYIDPNKKLNRKQQKKINFADIAFIESNNLKSFSESEFINSLDAGSNGIAVTNAQGLTGNTAEAGVGLAGSEAEAGVGLTGNTAEAGVGLAGNTAEVGIGLAGSTAEAGLEASKTEVGVGLTSMVEAKVGLTESEAEAGVGLAESAAEKDTKK